MPMPTPEKVRQLVAGLLDRHGYDLEDVEQTRAGKHSVLRLLVSADTGPDLDALSKLSGEVSELLDASDDSDTPYTLEVTTPGVDRPLTEARHWRRAQGRKVRIRLQGDTPRIVEGRAGQLAGDAVSVVMAGKAGPALCDIALADIAEAVVQVEFSPPNPRELELAGIPASAAATEAAPAQKLAAERPDK